MFPWQTQLFVARPRPIRRREFHVCHERYAILMSQGKTYARVLRLLLELAFTSGRDAEIKVCGIAQFHTNRNLIPMQADSFGSSKFFVETPTRIKAAPLTLRRKLRTSFALSCPLLHLISSCGFAAVSKATKNKFRSNSALALGAKHTRRSVSEAPLKPSEFDPKKRLRSTKFFEEARFCGAMRSRQGQLHP